MQKMLFLFGGLLLPLEIYPDWMQTIAWATPFPAILYGPASYAFDKSGGEIALLLFIQSLWVVLTSLAAIAALRAARYRIGREGD